MDQLCNLQRACSLGGFTAHRACQFLLVFKETKSHRNTSWFCDKPKQQYYNTTARHLSCKRYGNLELECNLPRRFQIWVSRSSRDRKSTRLNSSHVALPRMP